MYTFVSQSLRKLLNEQEKVLKIAIPFEGFGWFLYLRLLVYHDYGRKRLIKSKVIRQKDDCAYQEERNVRLLENAFWDSPFCLITDEVFREMILPKWFNDLIVITLGQCIFKFYKVFKGFL